MAKPGSLESNYGTRTLVFRTFMVVSYVCFGSAIFHLLERSEPSRDAAKFEECYNQTMWRILSPSISNETEMQIVMVEIRRTFLKESYPTEWDFLGGVNISVQAITTIGYGNTVPKTVAGRMFLIVYATIGIPLMAMMLTTAGDTLKHRIRSSLILFERKILKRSRPCNIQRKSLIAVFVITVIFLCSISIISATVENWEFSLALYVWFVTFTTIGFGDYIPQGSRKNHPRRFFEIAYALTAFFLGLVLIATILHALSDWIDSTKPPTKDDVKRSLGRVTGSLSTQKEEPSTNIEET